MKEAIRTCHILFFFLLSINSLHSQTSDLFGRIAESSTKDPLPSVYITMISLPDSNYRSASVSDFDGTYRFEDLDPGNYLLRVHFLGFKNFSTAIETKEGVDQRLDISLEASDFILNEIEIAANLPTYEHSIDRKIYYPGSDIMAQSGSVTDMLQNIPSLTVESEGEILLRGSGNITFLINGKPSGLLNANSAVILQQFPAHIIERIEIITNPSAKYKPDGIAGIINIITKKNVLPGFYGNVTLNASTQKRYNGNVALTYSPGHVSMSSLYSYWQNYSPRTYSDFRISRDSLTGPAEMFDLKNEAIGKSNSHTFNLSLDYSDHKKTTAGISGSYFEFQSERDHESFTSEITETQVVRDYQTFRFDKDNEKEFEISAYAERKFEKEDHTLSIEAEYGSYDELEDALYNDIYTIPAIGDFKGHTELSKKENSAVLSMDYTNPFGEDLELEAGYKAELSWGDLTFSGENFDADQNLWITDLSRTNRFLYQQDIHALYTTLSKSIDDFSILGGLRAEQTYIESELVDFDSIIPNHYFKLFPTLHLNYEIGDHHEFGLSYSRRINRPDPDELNPFPEYHDIRDIEAGNPHLKPEQVHSIELSYQYQKEKLSIVPSLYFRHTYDAFSEITNYINDTVLLTTLENLNQETNGGLEFVLSWSPDNKWNFNLSSNIFYQHIDADNLGYAGIRSNLSMDSRLAAYLYLFSSTRLQINGTARSSSLTAQGSRLPLYFVNAGLKQDIFRKKASITVTVSDVFNTMKWQYIIDTPLLYQKVIRKRTSQIVYFGFQYRFGITAKKNGGELLFDDKL